MLPAQPPQQTHGLEFFVPEEPILLEHHVEMRVVSEQVPRAAPPHQCVNAGLGKIGAQLVDQRRGEKGVPMPASEITRIFMAVQARRARLDSYGRAICSSGAALDSLSTKGMTIPREFTPAFWPQARRVGNEFRQKKLAAAFRHCPWERRHPCRRVAVSMLSVCFQNRAGKDAGAPRGSAGMHHAGARSATAYRCRLSWS